MTDSGNQDKEIPIYCFVTQRQFNKIPPLNPPAFSDTLESFRPVSPCGFSIPPRCYTEHCHTAPCHSVALDIAAGTAGMQLKRYRDLVVKAWLAHIYFQIVLF